MPYDNDRVAREAMDFAQLLMKTAIDNLSPIAAPAVASVDRVEAASDRLVAIALGASTFAAFNLEQLRPDMRDWVERNVEAMVVAMRRLMEEQRER